VRIKYLKVTGYRPKSFGIFIWGELNKNYKKKKKFISHKNATATRKGKKPIVLAAKLHSVKHLAEIDGFKTNFGLKQKL